MEEQKAVGESKYGSDAGIGRHCPESSVWGLLLILIVDVTGSLTSLGQGQSSKHVCIPPLVSSKVCPSWGWAEH